MHLSLTLPGAEGSFRLWKSSSSTTSWMTGPLVLTRSRTRTGGAGAPAEAVPFSSVPLLASGLLVGALSSGMLRGSGPPHEAGAPFAGLFPDKTRTGGSAIAGPTRVLVGGGFPAGPAAEPACPSPPGGRASPVTSGEGALATSAVKPADASPRGGQACPWTTEPLPRGTSTASWT